jgi:hypothetical protein
MELCDLVEMTMRARNMDSIHFPEFPPNSKVE